MRKGEGLLQLKEGLVHLGQREDLERQGHQDLNLTLDRSWARLNSKLGKRGHHLTPSPTCKHRLDLLDLGGLLVSEDHLDRKGSWDHREMEVILGPLDLLDLKEKLECQVFRVSRERMEVTEMQVPLVPQEDLEREDCQECREFQDQKDTEDSLVLMVLRETLDHLEKREKMDHLVLWELLDHWGHQVLEVKEGEMDLQECLDQEDWMEHLDLLVNLD